MAASGSGPKTILINSLERAVSTDINRLQAFIDQYLADTARTVYDPNVNYDIGSGANSNAVPPIVIGTPLDCHIYDGFMVLVAAAATTFSIMPGMGFVIDPDGQTGSSNSSPANPDDSIAKIIYDPTGVPNGVFFFVANSGGGIRVDVVEMQRNPGVVIETSSRDIYDPSTGLFTPALVNKVLASQVTYRVRSGTPGSGIPANVQGWCPICVIGVPTTATTFDTCSFWDVRPLIRDRSPGPSLISSLLSPIESRTMWVDAASSPGVYALQGEFRSTFGSYLAGGLFSTPDGTPWFDLNLSVNKSGFVSSANAITYLWLLFPLGLPRWVQYSSANISPFGGRIPSAIRGVPVVTSTGPATTIEGQVGLGPSAAINLPASAVLGGNTTAGKLAVAWPQDQSGRPTVFICQDDQLKFGQDVTDVTTFATIQLTGPTDQTTDETTAAGFNFTDQYVLTAGVHYPLSARRILVQVNSAFAATSDLFWAGGVSVRNPANAHWHTGRSQSQYVFGLNSAAGLALYVQWIELPYPMISVSPPATIIVRANWVTSAASRDLGLSSLIVQGWEF